MNKRVTKLLSLVLALVMVIGMIPTFASATETEDTASATVYFSVSNDNSFFNTGSDTMTLKKMTVPYFDIGELYGLSNLYYNPHCYDNATGESNDPWSGNTDKVTGQVAGTAETAKNNITMLHLLIYATEVYYLGVEPAKAGQGYLKDEGLLGSEIFGFSSASSVGSAFIQNFWGLGYNFNYYLNYEYPLGKPGWGATADQILIKDGDVISLAAFSDMSFHTDSSSGFHFFAENGSQHVTEANVVKGNDISLNLYRTKNGANYTTNVTLETRKPTVYYTLADSASSDWNDWSTAGTVSEDGSVSVDTTGWDIGSYIFAIPGMIGEYTSSTVSAPGAVLVDVKESGGTSETIPVMGITLSATTAEMFAGDTLTLTATVSPENATDKSVVWTSSNNSVATVSNGLITAVSAGTATITAKSGSFEAVCTVTVNAVTAPIAISVDGKNIELTDTGLTIYGSKTIAGIYTADITDNKDVTFNVNYKPTGVGYFNINSPTALDNNDSRNITTLPFTMTYETGSGAFATAGLKTCITAYSDISSNLDTDFVSENIKEDDKIAVVMMHNNSVYNGTEDYLLLLFLQTEESETPETPVVPDVPDTTFPISVTSDGKNRTLTDTGLTSFKNSYGDYMVNGMYQVEIPTGKGITINVTEDDDGATYNASSYDFSYSSQQFPGLPMPFDISNEDINKSIISYSDVGTLFPNNTVMDADDVMSLIVITNESTWKAYALLIYQVTEQVPTPAEPTYAAKIGDTEYDTVAAALAAAKSGDTVVLAKNVSADMITIFDGVTLDLNGKMLTAKYVFAVKSANVIDSVGDGVLKVSQGNITLSETNSMIPAWNGEGYIFDSAEIKDSESGMGMTTDAENDKLTFKFVTFFGDKLADTINGLLTDNGAEDNDLSIVVRLEWNTDNGTAYQSFVYNNEQVKTVIAADGKSAFTLTVNGYKGIENLKISAMILSDTGAQLAGNSFTVE